VRSASVPTPARRVATGKANRVTVCIASLFTWYHTDGTTQLAVLTASDRMITAGDIEYEPNQIKMTTFTRRIVGLFAGDFPTHSDAIAITRAALASDPSMNVAQVADTYGAALAKMRRKRAETTILAPLGLTSDAFLSRQHELAPSLVSDLSLQLQSYPASDTEALIVGSDDTSGYIYQVDGAGHVNCYNDVNFAAIGIGGWHARSQLMLSQYAIGHGLAEAMVAVYRAKKSAEVAPGVGQRTDMYTITRDGLEIVHPDAFAAVDEQYNEQYNKYKGARDLLLNSAVNDLMAILNERSGQQKPPSSPPPPSAAPEA